MAIDRLDCETFGGAEGSFSYNWGCSQGSRKELKLFQVFEDELGDFRVYDDLIVFKVKFNTPFLKRCNAENHFF